MKKLLYLIFLLLLQITYSQDNRINKLRNELDAIVLDAPGLSEKAEIDVKEAKLSNFLLGIAEVHKLNISVSPNLAEIVIVNNFKNVNVEDLLLFLCKEYNLTIDISGNILAIKSYENPIVQEEVKVIDVRYDLSNDLLSVNLKIDKLYDVFKKITVVSNKNIVYAPGIENQLLTSYIQNMPFDATLNKMAFENNLTVTKTTDGFYVFDVLNGDFNPNNQNGIMSTARGKSEKRRKSNFYFEVIDHDKQTLDVDIENTPIASVIYDLGNELGINVFIASPLENAGNVTVKAKNITFDTLLNKIFESAVESENSNSNTIANNNSYTPQQNLDVKKSTSNDSFTYKKNGNIYYFGTKKQLVVRNIKLIPLMYRSIALLSDPSPEKSSIENVTIGKNLNNDFSNSNINNNSNNNRNNNYSSGLSKESSPSISIMEIIPDEIKTELDIKIDQELNSFVVSGPAANIERFESFVKYIDKTVPVILIEVMLLEVNKSIYIETGITSGIGSKPVQTSGSLLPQTNITLGANTVNQILNSFSGFSTVAMGIGKVVPNFNLSIKAMEESGTIKIRSSPRLSTLNGHKAYLSIGETSYYVVTSQNFYGSQIPQVSEVKNYQPVDAQLSLTVMPLVSGDGQITLDIKVVQSRFNGVKVDKNAPPNINSREFTSIIRVKDQELIVLGGLEESVKSESGSGIPLLSRIPILKWIFSTRKKDNSKKKLTVLIKPTVIY